MACAHGPQPQEDATRMACRPCPPLPKDGLLLRHRRRAAVSRP
jgi:hypothetical protein